MVCILRTRNTHFAFKYVARNISLNAFAFHGCRKLYWSDLGIEGRVPAKIACANMDGTSRKNLFTGHLENVGFITLDIQEQKLYWTVRSYISVWASFLVCWSLCLSLHHCQLIWVVWQWLPLGHLYQCLITLSLKSSSLYYVHGFSHDVCFSPHPFFFFKTK